LEGDEVGLGPGAIAIDLRAVPLRHLSTKFLICLASFHVDIPSAIVEFFGGSELYEKLELWSMRIGVIGCGNVGFSMLLVCAEQGHQILGFDVGDAARRRIATELGLACVAPTLRDLAPCEIIFVCVPTDPYAQSRQCDLTTLFQVVREADQVLCGEPRPVLVIRSTCPPGTARQISDLITLPTGVNPSFLTKKTKLADTRVPPRIAYAGPPLVLERLDAFYGLTESSELFRTSNLEAVEYLKYVENCMDAVLISLWNEFFAYGIGVGLSIDDIIHVMERLGDRPRFASTVRVPGGAFGKWCLPKDLDALVCDARARGIPFNVLEAASMTNDWVRKTWGENPHAFHDLLELRGGRLALTEVALNWLGETQRESDKLTVVQPSRR
jgi:nucleotide sugar dehydrogenase